MKLSQLAPNFDAVLEQLREPDLSFSDRRQALCDAIRAEGFNPDGTYRYIEEIYDTWFIFYQYGEEEGGSAYFKASYTMSEDGQALVATPVQVKRVVSWEETVNEAALPPGSELVEGGFCTLVEAAGAQTEGELLLKVIAPGWNESKTIYYGAEILKRDCAEAFPVGTKMFWNHPTADERRNQPERDCDKIAAVLIEAAKWDDNGAAGPGPYARARVKNHYRDKVKDLVPDIGNSIYAAAKLAVGEAEGHTGKLVAQLVPSKQNTIDFVTYPGAGGEIVQLFESARPASNTNPDPVLEPKNSMTPAEIEALKAENEALKTANAQLAADKNEAVAEAAKLQLVPIAREAATKALEGMKMPEVTRQRVIESAIANPVLKEDGTLDGDKFAVQVKEAATSALAYLSEATGQKFVPSGTSPVRGAGSTGTVALRESSQAPAPTVATGVSSSRAANGLI